MSVSAMRDEAIDTKFKVLCQSMTSEVAQCTKNGEFDPGDATRGLIDRDTRLRTEEFL